MFGASCHIKDIREVDWYKKETRQGNFGVVTYWLVEDNGARLFAEKSESLDDNPPDYTYTCNACGDTFWFWSDVIDHVADARQ